MMSFIELKFNCQELMGHTRLKESEKNVLSENLQDIVKNCI